MAFGASLPLHQMSATYFMWYYMITVNILCGQCLHQMLSTRWHRSTRLHGAVAMSVVGSRLTSVHLWLRHRWRRFKHECFCIEQRLNVSWLYNTSTTINITYHHFLVQILRSVWARGKSANNTCHQHRRIWVTSSVADVDTSGDRLATCLCFVISWNSMGLTFF